MDKIVERLRRSFNTNKTLSLSWRMDQLKAMERLLDENQVEICDALKKDLFKHTQESIAMEISVVKNGIIYAMNNLEKWMQLEKVFILTRQRCFS
jgi:aldehyde dehydrogenase (NAD+)